MALELTLTDVEKAWQARDSITSSLLIQLVQSPEPQRPARQKREGEYTFEEFISEIHSERFRWKSDGEQKHFRQEAIQRLESGEGEPLADKYLSYQFIIKLWEDDSWFSRKCLLEIIEKIPLVYGPWKGLKYVFKQAEGRDIEIYAALAARFDQELCGSNAQVRKATLIYLCRRAWRYLRNLGRSLPVVYPDHACQVLQHYQDEVYLNNAWIMNHIFFHESGEYGSSTFYMYEDDLISDRAFAELWARSPRPLFSLLENAKAERVREFAIESLKTDFANTLRELEATWVMQLSAVASAKIDDFIVWLIKNVPRFEQSALKKLGLHEVVLKLFDSHSAKARIFAAEYARVYARDLPIGKLIELLYNTGKEIKQFALDMLREKDIRKDIGLDNLTLILQAPAAYQFASEALLSQYSSKELTAEWFLQCLLSDSEEPRKFAFAQLLQIHKREKLGMEYFSGIILQLMHKDTWQAHYLIRDHHIKLAEFAFEQLEKFDQQQLPVDFMQQIMIWPVSGGRVEKWVKHGDYQSNTLPIEFYRELAYEPYWHKSHWLKQMYAQYKLKPNQIEFNESLSAQIFEWLQDNRRFPAKQIGFDWLMELLQSDHTQYQTFASEMLLNRFNPADFAGDGTDTSASQAGCEKLWAMLVSTDKKQAAYASFAKKYIRRHHASIGKQITGQTVARQAQIPNKFLTYAQVKPLFFDARNSLRELAIEIAHWEFARWAPAIDEVIELCESVYDNVQSFMMKTLFAKATPENSGLLLDTSDYAVDDVFRFCHSRQQKTREIGMQLIKRQAHLQQAELLFKLTESTDRKVRGFAIKCLWRNNRHMSMVLRLKPNYPAEHTTILGQLRKSLFELPQAKLPKTQLQEDDEEIAPLRLVATRKAKLFMIEMIRDLALEDMQFAGYVLPLLEEFLASHGESEKYACLVALTRIKHVHQELGA